MSIIFILFILLILSITIRKFLPRLYIKQTFDNYIGAIKKLNDIADKDENSQIILNKVSSSGIKLILKMLLFFLPYAVCMLLLSIINIPFVFALILSTIPYVILIN